MSDNGNGYIRLHRQILKWEWWSNPNTFRMFIYLLLKANYCDLKFEGKTIHRGQLVTSIPKLAQETALTPRQVRVTLDHLKLTGEVTDTHTSKYRVITVVNYDKYQNDDRQDGNQMTGERQANDSQMTVSKEIKKDKKDKNNNKSLTRFIPPSVDEVREYCQSRNNGIDPETFVNFYESKGWLIGKNRMKDFRAAIRTWERKRKGEGAQPDARDVHGYEQRDYADEQKKALERMMNDEEW